MRTDTKLFVDGAVGSEASLLLRGSTGAVGLGGIAKTGGGAAAGSKTKLAQMPSMAAASGWLGERARLELGNGG